MDLLQRAGNGNGKRRGRFCPLNFRARSAINDCDHSQLAILVICVAVGFGAGMLRRQLDPSLQSQREQQIRHRLAGPAAYVSDADAQPLGQELRVIDRRVSVADWVSAIRTAALIAIVWWLARAQTGGIVLALAVGAFVGGTPTHWQVEEGSLIAQLLGGAVFGAGVAAVMWHVAGTEREPRP